MATEHAAWQHRLHLHPQRLSTEHRQPTRDHRRPHPPAGHLHQPDQQGRVQRVPRRSVEIPALRVARLPVVPAGPHRLPPARPGPRHRADPHRPGRGRARLEVQRRQRRPADGRQVPVRSLPGDRSFLPGFVHRAADLGSADPQPAQPPRRAQRRHPTDGVLPLYEERPRDARPLPGPGPTSTPSAPAGFGRSKGTSAW